MTADGSERVKAPFGARTAAITSHTRHGAYVVLTLP